jgi:hypothetical protein
MAARDQSTACPAQAPQKGQAIVRLVHLELGSHPRASGNRPDVSGSDPDGSGSSICRSGSYPSVSGSDPRASGSHPSVSGSDPSASGSHPDGSGSFPDISGWSICDSGKRPSASGNSICDSGRHPSVSGSDPDGSGSFPRASGRDPDGSGNSICDSGRGLRPAEDPSLREGFPPPERGNRGRRAVPGTAGVPPAPPDQSAERRPCWLLPARKAGPSAQYLEDAGETPAVPGTARPLTLPGTWHPLG